MKRHIIKIKEVLKSMKKDFVTLTVNKREYTFSVGTAFGQLPPSETLVDTLRNRLGLTGTKSSCNEGACGCCTVIKDTYAVASCMTLTVDCDGSDIITIEGLEDPEKGLDPIQQAFIDEYSFQCGYCTPGIIMSAKALFMHNPHPTAEEIQEALSGNFCRCISHYTVLRALNKVAGNEDAELSEMHRAVDDIPVEDRIPVRENKHPYSPSTWQACNEHSLAD